MSSELPVSAGASITDINRDPAGGPAAVNQRRVLSVPLGAGPAGRRRLLMEERILCSFFMFLKKNDLLKREMVSCLGLFFLLMIVKQARGPEGVSVGSREGGCVLVKAPPVGCVCVRVSTDMPLGQTVFEDRIHANSIISPEAQRKQLTGASE